MARDAVEPLWRSIYDTDPYLDFPVDDHPADTQGWGSTHPIFRYLIERERPAVVAEVGTWKGRSALGMATAAKRAGIATQIVCIDTWLGAPEHVLRRDYFASLRMRHGYPQLFHTFMANVVRAGHEDVITPLPQTSDNAAVLLRKMGIRPNLVYIDGAHAYDPVLRDLRNYWPLLARGGVLFGDDYPKGAGVTKAVHEFATEKDLTVVAGGGKFVLAAHATHQYKDVGMCAVSLDELHLRA